MEIKDRIFQFIESKGISVNSFEKSIGVSKSYFNNTKNISAKVLSDIVRVYSDLSSDWLLTGNGEMEKSSSPVINYERKGSPYYNVDFIGGFDLVLNDQTINPDYYIDFEPYNKEGLIWCNITGHSMEPVINHGDIIAIREIKDWHSYIPYGEIYAIVTTNNLRTVKIIRKGDDTYSYKLIPINTAGYDTQDISMDKIYKVFEVVGSVKRF